LDAQGTPPETTTTTAFNPNNRAIPAQIIRAGELHFFPVLFLINFRMIWCPLML
jgi:hypothetical protein